MRRSNMPLDFDPEAALALERLVHPDESDAEMAARLLREAVPLVIREIMYLSGEARTEAIRWGATKLLLDYKLVPEWETTIYRAVRFREDDNA